MLTSLWTAGSVCSVSGSFVLFSVLHNDPCTVYVCTAPSSNSLYFRTPPPPPPLLAIQANTRRLGLGSRSENKGQVHWEIKQNFKNAPDTFCRGFSCGKLITFWHSSHGHRGISLFSLTMAVTKTNLPSGGSWHAKFTKPGEACCPHFHSLLSYWEVHLKIIWKYSSPSLQKDQKAFLFFTVLNHTEHAQWHYIETRSSSQRAGL